MSGNRMILLLLSLFAMAAAAAPEEYAGSASCKTCHPAVWQNFYKNAHFRGVTLGCEGCHGAGKAHVQAGGGKATIPRAFSLMKPEQVIDACLQCHARDFARANIRR